VTEADRVPKTQLRVRASRWLLEYHFHNFNAAILKTMKAKDKIIPLPTTLPDTALSLKREHEIGDTL
jgi:hypothetical protein